MQFPLPVAQQAGHKHAMKGMLERKNQHRGRIDSTPSANMRWSKLRPKLLSTRRSSKAGAGAPTNSKPASLAVVDVHLEEKSQEAVCDVCAFRRRAHVIGCPRCGEGVPKVKPVGEGVPKVKPTPTASEATCEADSAAAAAGCPYHQAKVAAVTAAAAAAPAAVAVKPIPPSEPKPITAWPRVPEGSKLKKPTFPRPQANIDDLLTQHADAIATLRKAVADDANLTSEVDDIWLLRFILSNGSASKAEGPLRATLAYRAEHRERLAQAASEYSDPKHLDMSKYSIADLLPAHVTSLSNEPILVVRVGRSDVKALMDRYTEDEVVDSLNYSKETAFRRCDQATRETRRLVKMITVLDMAAMKLSGNDKRFMKALGRSSREAEVRYPQLLALTVPINAPFFIGLLWGIGKRFLPARTLAKMRFCGSRDSCKQSAAECPVVGHNFSPDALCTFLGGTLPPTPRLKIDGVDGP